MIKLNETGKSIRNHIIMIILCIILAVLCYDMPYILIICGIIIFFDLIALSIIFSNILDIIDSKNKKNNDNEKDEKNTNDDTSLYLYYLSHK